MVRNRYKNNQEIEREAQLYRVLLIVTLYITSLFVSSIIVIFSFVNNMAFPAFIGILIPLFVTFGIYRIAHASVAMEIEAKRIRRLIYYE